MSAQTIEIQPSTPPPEPPPAIPEQAGWGVTGAIAVWVAQRAWEAFVRKEAAEEKLTTSLVQTLQDSQDRLLNQLVVVQREQYIALQGLKDAIDNFSHTFQKAFEMHDRKITQLEKDVRDLKDRP